MATAVPKTIGEALDAVKDEDFNEEEEVVEEEAGEEAGEAEGEPAEGEEKAEGEEAAEGEAGPAEEKVEAEEEDTDLFDQLTAEDLAAIKADPALNKLRKTLMREYSGKTTNIAQLIELSRAYDKDPRAVIEALAASQGLTLAEAKRQAEAASAVAAEATAAGDPGADLEQLFGPQIGPKVRAVFEKWLDVRTGTKLNARVAPVEQTLGTFTQRAQEARMQSEEAAFKSRHKDITPEVERAVVELGHSGKIVPGNMTPAEYLDTLYDVVMARQAREKAKRADSTASTKLAKRIEGNRRDREPSGVGSKAPVARVSRVGEAKTISEALDIAMEELDAESR